MGHDISGYKLSNQATEVAYLRRSAFNQLNGEIYTALNCHQHNGGVSGYGTDQIFTKEEILKALEYIGDKEVLNPEREFLTGCLNNLEDDKILIGFY